MDAGYLHVGNTVRNSAGCTRSEILLANNHQRRATIFTITYAGTDLELAEALGIAWREEMKN